MKRGSKVGFEAGLVELLVWCVGEQKSSSVVTLALCAINRVEMINLQVDNHICVNISLYTSVAILNYFFPYTAISDFRNQCTPFRSPKGSFSILWAKLNNSVQNGKI